MRKIPAYRITSRVEIPASNTYFVWRGDQEYGPYTIPQIRLFWDAGQLVAEDYIRESHNPEWIDAGSFLLPILTSEETHPYLPKPAPEVEDDAPDEPAIPTRISPQEANFRPSRWLKALVGCSLLVFVGTTALWTFQGQARQQQTTPPTPAALVRVEPSSKQPAINIGQTETPALSLQVADDTDSKPTPPRFTPANELPPMPSPLASALP